jgi:hypothetical protein
MGMDNSNQLKFTSGNSLALIGLPFFLIGGLFTFVPIFVALFGRGQFNPGLIGGSLFGSIFFLIGALMIFYRSGVTLENKTRTVMQWRKFIVPLKTTVRNFNEFKWVVITREERHAKNSTYYVYPVRLSGAGQDIGIDTPASFSAARAKAEQAAKFIGLGIRDETGDKPIIREAGTLDESLRKRLQRTNQFSEPPQPLANNRIIVKTSSGEATFEIPAPGLTALNYISFVASLIVPGIFLTIFASNMKPKINFDIARLTKQSPELFFLGVVLLMVFIPFLLAVVTAITALARERLVVSYKKLSLERRYMIGSRHYEIPGDKLEEVEIANMATNERTSSLDARRKIISARSDNAIIEFGAGLNEQEREWLHNVIKYIIAAPAGQKLPNFALKSSLPNSPIRV